MILNWREDRLAPAEAWNALGQELPEKTFYIDTDSGLIKHYRTDDNGKILFYADRSDVQVIEEFVPLPIRIEWKAGHPPWEKA